MKSFIYFLVALAGIFLLANIMVNDSGYVLISYNNATFETTLWGMLVLAMVVSGVSWLAWLIIKMLFGVTSLVYPITREARERQARKLMTRGFVEFTQGHWKKAERYLSKAADSGDSPLLNYLAAARAAHENDNHEASAEYLRQADRKEPGSDLAIGITQAQLQLSSGQLEQALAMLTKLHKQHPRHGYVLKMLKQAYCRLHDWQALSTLLPQLKKQKIVADQEYRQLEQKCYGALFEQAYSKGRSFNTSDDRLKPANQVWNNLSSSLKRDPEMIYRYADCLAQLNGENKAESVLRERLGKYYNSDMILLFGKVKGRDTSKQLHFAESLLNERPNDASLLLTLGRLALRNELWGKAKEYFEASLRHQRHVDTYNELGRLMAHMEDHEGSSKYFQEGLRLAADSVVDLPLPAIAHR
ncbi:heme biosynthesis protein HemY [Endozoicomonas sp. OPT23]|uniref:heme biosynthesis HemY N-terminal domain-containing protein n=1 Tax=Endozoicomonas sp. OPT23 TaxID=2072845 RepID=UPI00129AD5A8|nr:heme biosynthesis HemY N-terminal domain-containing protein [Endozoicomonas sp. OPT23]MRI31590.1 heme biosynthesis protein HemY [Endozoicomonas sp. OPT23]